MPVNRLGGSGIGLTRPPVYNASVVSNNFGKNTNVNEVQLAAGQSVILPPGNQIVTPGPYSMVQWKDQISGVWRSFSQVPNVPRQILSDGVNYRLANLTGCAIGATITNVGSGYTSAPTVSPSAGNSEWVAIVGGAVDTTVTITTAGAGYDYAPTLIIEPPQSSQGVQATATCTVSAGAINAVTVVNQGAGYTSAPAITIVPDPRDTSITTEAVLTSALTGSGTLTAILCTNHGTALTSVPTLTISGGGGASGAATVVMCFAATGITVVDGGAVYGNAQPFVVVTADGKCAATPGAVTNPSFGNDLLVPRLANIRGTSTAGGAVTATGLRVIDGGLFSAVPIGACITAGAAVPTTTATITVTVGGVSDLSLLQAA